MKESWYWPFSKQLSLNWASTLKLKFSLNEPITNTKLIELRIFGSSQELVKNAIKRLSKKQIEASLLKIKEIDLICKGLRTGDPWLELNRFAFGISRLINKKSE